MSEPIENIEQLKACPFCGNPHVKPELEGRGQKLLGYVICQKCYNRGPATIGFYPLDLEDFVKLWNTRPVEDALTAERDALKEQIKNDRRANLLWVNCDGLPTYAHDPIAVKRGEPCPACQAQAEVERLREAQRWIPCTVQMPRTRTYVLALTLQGRIYQSMWAHVDGQPYWEIYDGRIYPTHWMPLPEPPVLEVKP